MAAKVWNSSYNEKIANAIQEEFVSNVHPSDFLIVSFKNDIEFTQQESDRIKSAFKNYGQHDGGIELLRILVKKLDWFPHTMAALRDPFICCSHVADAMEHIREKVDAGIKGDTSAVGYPSTAFLQEIQHNWNDILKEWRTLRDENRTTKEELADLKDKHHQLSKRVNIIESVVPKPTVLFSAKMKVPEALFGYYGTPLAVTLEVLENIGGVWHEREGRMVIPEQGEYRMRVEMKQKGSGVVGIGVREFLEGRGENSQEIGRTSGDGHVSMNSCLRHYNKMQKVELRVRCLEENPALDYCTFTFYREV